MATRKRFVRLFLGAKILLTRNVQDNIQRDRDLHPKGELSQRPKHRTLIFAVIASLLIHVLFFGMSVIVPTHKREVKSGAPMRARLITKESKKEAKKEEKENLRKPVVTIAPPAKLERPQDADYLAEFDQSVKEQTKS